MPSQLATTSLSSGLQLDRAAVAAVERLKTFVSQVRALKAEHNLASRRDVKRRQLAEQQAKRAELERLLKGLG
jgi:valyl-tRNA synthetase